MGAGVIPSSPKVLPPLAGHPPRSPVVLGRAGPASFRFPSDQGGRSAIPPSPARSGSSAEGTLLGPTAFPGGSRFGLQAPSRTSAAAPPAPGPDLLCGRQFLPIPQTRCKRHRRCGGAGANLPPEQETPQKTRSSEIHSSWQCLLPTCDSSSLAGEVE